MLLKNYIQNFRESAVFKIFTNLGKNRENPIFLIIVTTVKTSSSDKVNN